MIKKLISGVVAFTFLVTYVYAADDPGHAAPAAAEATAAAALPAAPPAAPAAAEVTPEASTEPGVTTDPGNVTVNFKGADIRTVLAYISEVAGIDIVPAPDVKGIVDLKLTNKPWKVALDIIMKNYGFAYDRDGDIIRVVTLDKLRQEEVVTQTFSLNYAKAKDVATAIGNMLSSRGKIMFDARTNLVIVTDIPTNVYKIAEVVVKLDKMTSQVLIETIAIETTLGDNERMGIDWTARVTATGAKRPTTFPFDYWNNDSKYLDKYTPLVQTSVTSTQIDPASGLPFSIPPAGYPAGASGATSNAKGFPFVDFTQEIFKDTFMFGTLDFSEFKAVMEFIKSRADVDVVANPRIMTLDNEPATIHVGLNVFLPKFERNSTTGKMEITGYEYAETTTDDKTGKETQKGLKSGVNLRVVPHVNENGEIIVDLEPSISDELRFQPIDPQGNIVAPVINERTAKTQARIRDGDTIFIGGLIHETDEVIDNTLPFIGDATKDVPYLGLLFNHKSTKKVKKELIFFVTVHIMTPGKKVPSAPVPDFAPKAEYVATQDDKPGKVQPKKKNWVQNILKY